MLANFGIGRIYDPIRCMRFHPCLDPVVDPVSWYDLPACVHQISDRFPSLRVDQNFIHASLFLLLSLTMYFNYWIERASLLGWAISVYLVKPLLCLDRIWLFIYLFFLSILDC